jgi:hypothetical protein
MAFRSAAGSSGGSVSAQTGLADANLGTVAIQLRNSTRFVWELTLTSTDRTTVSTPMGGNDFVVPLRTKAWTQSEMSELGILLNGSGDVDWVTDPNENTLNYYVCISEGQTKSIDLAELLTTVAAGAALGDVFSLRVEFRACQATADSVGDLFGSGTGSVLESAKNAGVLLNDTPPSNAPIGTTYAWLYLEQTMDIAGKVVDGTAPAPAPGGGLVPRPRRMQVGEGDSQSPDNTPADGGGIIAPEDGEDGAPTDGSDSNNVPSDENGGNGVPPGGGEGDTFPSDGGGGSGVPSDVGGGSQPTGDRTGGSGAPPGSTESGAPTNGAGGTGENGNHTRESE